MLGDRGRLQQASMSCTGATNATVHIDSTFWGRFRAQFTGVKLIPSCNSWLTGKVLCSLTICSGTLVLQDSIVSSVRETPGGIAALLCAVHDSRLEVYNSVLTGNFHAPFIITERASMLFHNSSVSLNNPGGGFAGPGGGFLVEGDARLTITAGSRVNGNTADNGGGVVVRDNARLVVANGSSIYNNSASLGGGGVYANGISSVTISNSSVHGNTAQDNGGGLHCMAASLWTVTRGSSIYNNTAHWGGAGIYAQDTSKVLIFESVVHSNVATTYCGGGLSTRRVKGLLGLGGRETPCWRPLDERGSQLDCQTSDVNVTGSHVYNNTSPAAGGGMCIFEGTRVALHNSTVRNNKAFTGGGLAVYDEAVVVVSGGCSIVDNSCTGGAGGGIAVGFDVNSFNFGGKGRLNQDKVAKQGNLRDNVTISNSTIANNVGLGGAGGGLAVAARSVVNLTGGTKVIGNQVVNGSGGAVMLSDNSLLQADNTVVFNHNVVNSSYVGGTIVAFGNSRLSLPSHGQLQLTKCSTGVYLSRAPCGVGETLQHDVCMCCPPHTFSFSNDSCTKCPANAVCPGASIAEPLPGFWTSAPTSIQMHRCPLFKTACDYVNQTHVCKAGYQGALCGECQLPLYGMLSPMRCGLCMRPPVQLGLYLTVTSVTVSFVTYTVHATWQENLEGTREVLITDYIKVLVLFLQYIVIIGSVSVPWPLFDVQQWLQAIGIVVTIGSGQALSLDCWLYHYFRHVPLPIAIQRQLVYFLAPVAALMAVLALQCLFWALQRLVRTCIQRCRQPKEMEGVHSPWLLLRKLPVTVLVLVFYAYPTLTRASLSFFACLKIDEPLTALTGVPMGATALLSHKWGYWVGSINQQCFAGFHLRWAMGLGLPSVLLWCVIVPVAMGVGLHMCRSRADSGSFREHFGFLYRTYRPECMWWEAVWAARTVLLTLVSVFSFPMQRYYSVLSLLLVFWASAALQIVFKPYAVSTLHRMHLISTSCLAATTMGALAMFAYDIQESTAYALRVAVTVLVFVINLVFVGWCCLKLAPVLKEWCMDFGDTTKDWVEDVLECVGQPTRKRSARGRRGASSRLRAV
jgi:hypothetical protein